jgi:GNAT superfamily N-acetyltransferase
MWRLATAADDLAVLEMFQALYREDPSPDPVPDEQLLRTLRVLREEPRRGRAIVLESDGACVGYALLISFWSNELGGEVANIDELYVAADHRGRGAGTRLVEQLARGELWGAPAGRDRPRRSRPTTTAPRHSTSGSGFVVAKNTVMRRRL